MKTKVILNCDYESKLFKGVVKKVHHCGNLERYENLIRKGKLLASADLVKEQMIATLAFLHENTTE